MSQRVVEGCAQQLRHLNHTHALTVLVQLFEMLGDALVLALLMPDLTAWDRVADVLSHRPNYVAVDRPARFVLLICLILTQRIHARDRHLPVLLDKRLLNRGVVDQGAAHVVGRSSTTFREQEAGTTVQQELHGILLTQSPGRRLVVIFSHLRQLIESPHILICDRHLDPRGHMHLLHELAFAIQVVVSHEGLYGFRDLIQNVLLPLVLVQDPPEGVQRKAGASESPE
mmetsp:Transcript_109316/g.233622  ORF Transcript_109316/g.233622 Transcript_109316/m.233622 type:complete len:228 (-) Transcript_109316:710-1393(-)